MAVVALCPICSWLLIHHIFRFFESNEQKGIQSQFVLNYIDRNREELTNKYSDFSHFLTDFKVDENIMKELIEHAEKVILNQKMEI